MSKLLVTYFSASGVTANVARNIANNLGADTFLKLLKIFL